MIFSFIYNTGFAHQHYSRKRFGVWDWDYIEEIKIKDVLQEMVQCFYLQNLLQFLGLAC